MKKRIAVILIFILAFVAISYTQIAMTNTQASKAILQNQNKTLEARVVALEAKVARLEKIIQDPPVRIIPCEAE